MRGYYRPYYEPYGGGGLTIKGVLIVTAIVILLIVGIFIYANVKAKKALAEELPSQYADEQYTSDESRTIRYLASSIKDDLSRFIQGGHKLDIYKELLRANDRIFTGVAVDYKRVAGESLRESLSDSHSSFSLNLTEGTFGESMEVYNQLLNRLNMLKLT